MTNFEFALLKGTKGRGGTPIGVKAPYQLLRKVEEDAAAEEVIKVAEKPEIPRPEASTAPEPVVEPPPPDPKPEPVVKAVVETIVEPVEEPVVEEVVEEAPAEPVVPDYSGVRIDFDPPSPQYTESKVVVRGVITGLTAPDYFLSINRIVNGNGTEFTGEVALNVEGDRAVASIRDTPLGPVSSFL